MEMPITADERGHGLKKHRDGRVAFEVARAWVAFVVAILGFQFMFRAQAQGPMDAQVVFALVFSGYTASVVLVREALYRRSALNTLLGALVGFVLVALAYLYFPMGPAECYDWIQESVLEGRYTIP